MRAGLALAALLLPAAVRAETMVATRPGLMCTSPAALATLTMHDGSNRGAGARAHPDDDATKQMGGCIDIPHGARVVVHQRRVNTSIVSYDAGDGGGARSFIVPNIDFTTPEQATAAAGPPAADPVTAFFAALNQHCPALDWEHAEMRSYGPPLEEAAKSLDLAQHGAMTSQVGEACHAGAQLECGNTVAIRFMVQAGRLEPLTRAFCTAAASTADSVRY